jgi:hypothetical protein
LPPVSGSIRITIQTIFLSDIGADDILAVHFKVKVSPTVRAGGWSNVGAWFCPAAGLLRLAVTATKIVTSPKSRIRPNEDCAMRSIGSPPGKQVVTRFEIGPIATRLVRLFVRPHRYRNFRAEKLRPSLIVRRTFRRTVLRHTHIPTTIISKMSIYRSCEIAICYTS